jgi:methylmalonyl-CoA carboxyltransferase 12S subunit
VNRQEMPAPATPVGANPADPATADPADPGRAQPAGAGPAELVAAVAALRAEVARLADRIAALETTAAATPAPAPAAAEPAAPAPAAAAAVDGGELSEELVLVISAAVAAYLGKKPYIRQIRLVTSPTWSHQGRVSVQASHALGLHYRSGAPA